MTKAELRTKLETGENLKIFLSLQMVKTADNGIIIQWNYC